MAENGEGKAVLASGEWSPAVADRVRPPREPVCLSLGGGRGPIVGNADLLNAEEIARSVDYGIARVGGSGFDDVRLWRIVSVGRASDAPRIHDRASVIERTGRRRVIVTAEDHGTADLSEQPLDLRPLPRDQTPVKRRGEQIDGVIRRRSMKHRNLFPFPGSWEPRQPVPVALAETVEGESSHSRNLSPGGAFDENAILVPGHGLEIQVAQRFDCGARIERAVEAVSQLENPTDPSPSNVGEDGIEGPRVAVNVRDHRKARLDHSDLLR
jgi:hypothetical protein